MASLVAAATCRIPHVARQRLVHFSLARASSNVGVGSSKNMSNLKKLMPLWEPEKWRIAGELSKLKLQFYL
jgi:hypothetical protein